MKHLGKLAGQAMLLAMLGVAGITGAAHAANTTSVSVHQAGSRQLLGTVTGVTDFEASPPSAGTYVFEYEVDGVSGWDTYVDGAELGYVGGPTGVYRTRTVALTAGGHLVRVAGPEGYGSARAYLVGL